MNKNIVKYLLALAVVALAGGGCEVNDFNDKLDGFESGSTPSNIQTVTRTLSAADYSAIASNKENVAMAKELGPDAEKALKAIGINKFIDADDAQLYLPAFLSSTYGYLDNKSAVQVSYVNKNKGSEILGKTLSNQYTLADADYNAAWGANHGTPFFTPAKPASEFMPAILKTKVKDVAAGDYAIATYTYSLTEPNKPTTTSSTYGLATRADVAVKKIADINFSGKEEASAEGIVIALHAQGVLFKDDSGIALFYNGAETFLSLGDKIRVSGKTQLRYGVNQFDKGGKHEFIEHPTAEFAYPASPVVINKDNIRTYAQASTYVSMTGELKVDGIYMNLLIDGVPEAEFRGGLSYIFPSMDMASLNGKQITVTGYYLGNSGSTAKNFTLLVTSVKEVGGADITATGVAATKAGTYTCKGIVVTTYDKGFLMNDGTGNILIYQNKTSTVEQGTLVTVSGDTEIRNSMAQFKSSATVTAGTKLTVTNPTPAVFDAAAVNAYMTAPIYRYAKIEGKLSKSDKGYYEIHDIEGTEKYGSFSYPVAAQKTILDGLLNKKVIVTGYLIGSNTTIGYFNVIFGAIEPKDKNKTETRYAVYTYDGSAWAPAETKDAAAINEADYKEMGLSNIYFDATNAPGKYVLSFLNKQYAYPQVDQETTIFYNYKESGDAYAMGAAYKFDGTAWLQNIASEQYVKSTGKWKFNPSPTIVVAPDKSPASVKIYQTVADYVKNTYPKYATKYDNEGNPSEALVTGEMYSGCDAKFTNLNWRINTLPWYYWKWAEGAEAVKVYEDWSSTDKAKQKASYQAFYAEVEKRFGEVMAAALGKLYPTAVMMPDVDIIYTIQMMLYTQHIGSSTGKVTHAFEFKLVNTGKFEYKGMYALDPKFELMSEENFK